MLESREGIVYQVEICTNNAVNMPSQSVCLTAIINNYLTRVDSFHTNEVRRERVSKFIDRRLDNLYAQLEVLFVPVDRLLGLRAIDSVRSTPSHAYFEVVARRRHTMCSVIVSVCLVFILQLVSSRLYTIDSGHVMAGNVPH